MHYEINKKTLAIIPSGDNCCKILEGKRRYNLNQASFKVIEESCEHFGVSYKARVKGSQKFIKSRYKAPIIIEETSGIIFIPASSPRNDTLWISYNNIFDFFPSSKKKSTTIVKFKNGKITEVPISYYSFNNQFLKASRLSSVIANRYK